MMMMMKTKTSKNLLRAKLKKEPKRTHTYTCVYFKNVETTQLKHKQSKRTQ